MTTTERRAHPRYKALNLLSYVCLDEDGSPTKQGMGRTLDVSEGGILMETHQAISSRFIVFLSLGLGDDVANIRGKVIYSREGKSGKIESGVEFEETDKTQQRIVREYLKAWKEQYKDQE